MNGLPSLASSPLYQSPASWGARGTHGYVAIGSRGLVIILGMTSWINDTRAR